MLQDLDQLAARIGQLVQRAQQLTAERDALRARLSEAETEQRTLRQRCAQRDTEFAALEEKFLSHDSTVAAVQLQAQQIETGLREQLARESTGRQQHELTLAAHDAQAQSALALREAEVQRLRQAASNARERIDAVLTRLPGAPAAEAH